MLINEIIEGLVGENSDVSGALLKTKLFLHKIGRIELAEWVTHELTGYPTSAQLPGYRRVPTEVLADLEDVARIYEASRLPLGHLNDAEREFMTSAGLRQSLTALEALKDAELTLGIPIELYQRLGRQLRPSVVIQRAWRRMGSMSIRGILINVKSRLLDFMLALKAEMGDATTDGDIETRAAGIDAAGLFQNAIFGNNTTIVVGQGNNTTIANAAGDLTQLISTLEAAGVPTSDVLNLRTILESDAAAGKKPTLSGSAGQWLTKMLEKAASGASEVGVSVVTTVVTAALMNYFGLSSST